MSAEYPGAVWVPSPNYGYPRGTQGRNGLLPIAIVCHTTAGPWTAVHSWFQNPSSHASAHFQIRRNGVIDQFVLLGNAAWANGIDFARGYDAYKSERSIAWIDKCWRERVNPNLVTVSIEFEGNPGEPLTDAQYAAGLALIKWLCKECDIAPTGEFIVGHYQIDRVNRRSCPGPAFPWARLFSDLNPVEIAHYERLRGPLDELWRRAKVLEQIGTDTIRIGREIEAYIVQTKKQAGFPD